ncbi:MAG TPA: leucyl aminopeptidase [Gammaproteobacteria bacterium]|jgi:leucyl aminopeptidase|nr:leucyl aminopeptidase [Gammaproteobacteria bacterium]
MEFPVKTGAAASQRTECAILPVFEDGQLRGATREIDTAARGIIRQLVRKGDIPGRVGSTTLIHRTQGTAAARWLLVGCGKYADFNARRLASALGSAVGALRNSGTREAISYLAYGIDGVDSAEAARHTVEAARASLYRFDELKSRTDPVPRLARLGIAAPRGSNPAPLRAAIRTGTAIANGSDLARDLGNRPPNVCTPSHLAESARKLAGRFRKLKVKVLGEPEIRRLGMGALLSVTQGADEPPRVIVIEYRNGARKDAPIALCGKGVTFDTGGISLKPPPKMDEMKYDMSGAGSVLGALAAIAELDAPVNVVGVIPACENMPGGRATRPGDIVKSMSGQTIEIINTDAEGRLILCDAITYARREFKPSCVIDIATLTGACVIALGHVYTGVFSNDDALAAKLIAAGDRALDLAWRMPVHDEYGESLRSNFADFANAGSRDGGASVGANFLSRFVDATPWAHLDIAGVAWRANSQKGSTARPVPLLVDFLLNAERQ